MITFKTILNFLKHTWLQITMMIIMLSLLVYVNIILGMLVILTLLSSITLMIRYENNMYKRRKGINFTKNKKLNRLLSQINYKHIVRSLNMMPKNSVIYISSDLNDVLNYHQYINTSVIFIIDTDRTGFSYGLTMQKDMLHNINDLYE